MNRLVYENPEMSVERFETEDVITSSDPDGEGWSDFIPIDEFSKTSKRN